MQCLLHRIPFEEGIVTPRKNVCLILPIEKKQKRNNGNNNNNSNYDDSNSINDNSFRNENNCQTPKKQLLFITLPYKGQQGEKVI